jgi:hypothetical protein
MVVFYRWQKDIVIEDLIGIAENIIEIEIILD